MNTALIMYGIESVVRLGRVSIDALEQQARDAEAVFPQVDLANFNPRTHVASFFTKSDAHKAYVIGDDAPYAEFWANTQPKQDRASIDALVAAAFKIEAERQGAGDRARRAGAAMMVRQWSDASKPLSPWGRIVLSAGDIVLEYVAANPSVLGGDGNGEKLIAAFASNLSELLPDDGKFGAKEQFLERLAGAFLKAGLGAIADNPGWVASEEHITRLLSESLTPLRDAFPADIAAQLRWDDVSAALAGPVASAALRTVASHQSAFLGQDFATEKAVGAVTRAVLLEAADTGLSDSFTQDGLVGLYTAIVGVAAEQPQLFIGGDNSGSDAFARQVFADLMGTLKRSPPPFDSEVGVQLAGVALGVVRDQLGRFAKDSDWQQTVSDVLDVLFSRLSEAIRTNEKLSVVLSRSQLTAIGRIILENIAESPRLLLGSDEEPWEGVLSAVTAAMAADEDLLLSGDDWIDIAAVAAREAAANPGRLFKLDDTGADVIAGEIITALLEAASEGLKLSSKEQSVLFGKTLSRAIEIALRASSGNLAAAIEHIATIRQLAIELNTFVLEHADRYGSKEWLQLFRRLLSGVLAGAGIPGLTTEKADEILKGAGL